MLRTFISFDTPEAFKQVLKGVVDELQQSEADIRWEKMDKFHGTIKFLGNTDEALLPRIEKTIDTVTAGFGPITLHFDRLGCFPSPRNPKVLWAGCGEDSPALSDLRTGLDKALSPFGFEAEARKFHPHVTLGRFKSSHGAKDLISKSEKINFGTFTVSIGEILLMKSVLTPNGSLYTVLRTYPLKKLSRRNDTLSKDSVKTPQKTIFLVDDELVWLDALSEALEQQNFSVVSSDNGEEALKKLRTKRPDLILSDVRMPAMNGFDLYERVRNDPQLKDIPYVFMSSIDDFDAKRVAKELGADDYVIKPYDTEDVKRIMIDLMKRFNM